MCYLITWLHFFLSSITKPPLRLLAFLPPIQKSFFYWSLFTWIVNVQQYVFSDQHLCRAFSLAIKKKKNMQQINNYHSCMLFTFFIYWTCLFYEMFVVDDSIGQRRLKKYIFNMWFFSMESSSFSTDECMPFQTRFFSCVLIGQQIL